MGSSLPARPLLTFMVKRSIGVSIRGAPMSSLSRRPSVGDSMSNRPRVARRYSPEPGPSLFSTIGSFFTKTSGPRLSRHIWSPMRSGTPSSGMILTMNQRSRSMRSARPSPRRSASTAWWTIVDGNDVRAQMDLFAREFLLPRPVIRKLHLEAGLTGSAIADRLGAPFEVLGQQMLDALLLPPVTPIPEEEVAERPAQPFAGRRGWASGESPICLRPVPGPARLKR